MDWSGSKSEFEKAFKKFLKNKLEALAVGSGTDALLGILLADIKKVTVLAPYFVLQLICHFI